MKTVLAISSHLDDLVLGAGQFMAGRPDVLGLTVLAGEPAHNILTSYDASCGFKSSHEAMEARRREDAEAMSSLQAKYQHLRFLDSQYAGSVDTAAIVRKLSQKIDEMGDDIDFILTNMGLVHPDHIAVRDAVLEATKGCDTPLWLWEDLPARVQHPESVGESLDALRVAGYETELGFIGTGSVAKKMDALFCYRSQLSLPEFENRHEFLVNERFWKISRAVTPEDHDA